jgi:hypothetical protein
MAIRILLVQDQDIFNRILEISMIALLPLSIEIAYVCSDKELNKSRNLNDE